MSVPQCTHLAIFKSSGGVKSYELVHGAFVACILKSSRKKKVHACYCFACNKKTPRLHVCLFCVYFGCYGAQHIHKHAHEKEHFLALDANHGTIYCFKCGDYVYDAELDAISMNQKKTAAKSLGMNSKYIQWEPSNIEIELLKHHSKRRTITDPSCIGLRGLVNLGSTCFLNSAIQVLTHAPLLRDHFLTECHVCQFKEDTSLCITCELSLIFQEFYSGNDAPYIPCGLLRLLWIHVKHLATFQQHDAHECFIAMLDILHEQSKDNTNYSNQCSCIVCQIFKGKLQSDVICQKCKNVSTSYDDMIDVSLCLGNNSDHADQSVMSSEIKEKEPMSLLDCLERFTRPEHLGKSSLIKCNICQDYQESVKQFTVNQLPLIICFHLKRFEIINKFKKKISRKISFPQYINMTPFMSSYRSINISKTEGDKSSTPFSNCNNKYYLFAVINHIGPGDSTGHYKTFISQCKDQWFICDDEFIYRTSLEDVLDSEAYLLFYHKQILEYEYEDTVKNEVHNNC